MHVARQPDQRVSCAGVLVGSLAVTRGVTALGRENFLPPLAAVVSHRLGTPIFATAILGIATGAGPSNRPSPNLLRPS